MEKNTKRNLLTVGAIAGIVVLGGTVGANAASQVTSSDIKDQTIQSRDIAADGVGKSEIRTGAVGSLEILNQSIQSIDLDEGSVGRSEIRNGTITTADIADSTEASLVKRATDFAADADADIINEAKRHATAQAKFYAHDEAQGVLSVAREEDDSVLADAKKYADENDESGVSVTSKSFEGKVVEDMGGSWGTLADPRATPLGEVTVEQSGQYVVTADGFFTSSGNPVAAQVQTAVRVENGTKWGRDLGTAFATTGTWKDRDYTTSSTRVVDLEKGDVIKVFAFGYDVDGESAQNSGKFTASAYLTLTLAD